MTYAAANNIPTWEIWHKQYGHISYSGLCKLYEKNLVSRFIVNKNSPTPDCEACIQAKPTEEPYNQSTESQMSLGELMHMDLWGKYDVVSIHGHQYYIAFMVDAARYLTVEFLK